MPFWSLQFLPKNKPKTHPIVVKMNLFFIFGNNSRLDNLLLKLTDLQKMVILCLFSEHRINRLSMQGGRVQKAQECAYVIYEGYLQKLQLQFPPFNVHRKWRGTPLNAIQIVIISVSGFCDAFHKIINFIKKTFIFLMKNLLESFNSSAIHFFSERGSPKHYISDYFFKGFLHNKSDLK